MTNKSYFNTTGETNPQLQLYVEDAKAQERKVLQLFEQEQKPMAASEVYNKLIALHMISTKIPEASIKRCCTNLKNEKLLMKTTEKVLGNYGKPNYKYQLTMKKAG